MSRLKTVTLIYLITFKETHKGLFTADRNGFIYAFNHCLHINSWAQILPVEALFQVQAINLMDWNESLNQTSWKEKLSKTKHFENKYDGVGEGKIYSNENIMKMTYLN